MTPGQLVKAVAIALDVSEETVTQHDRNLVVAGLRTKGGRGRSAPDVTPLDAARLFISTLWSVRAKDSVETVKRAEGAIFDPQDHWAEYLKEHGKVALEKAKEEAARREEAVRKELGYSIPERERFADDPAIAALPQTHNLVEAIASLISHASAPIDDLDLYLKRFAEILFSCRSAPFTGHIGKNGQKSASYRNWPPAQAGNVKAGSKHPELPRHIRYARYFGIHQDRMAYGSSIMLLGKAFREDGLDFESTRDALASLLGGQKPTKKKKVA
jgi:hypothetical protein